MKKIGIMRSRVVGSARGKGFYRPGHDVLFYDITKQLLLNLNEHGCLVGSVHLSMNHFIIHICKQIQPLNYML
jgi:hypothetical protein